MRLGLNVRIGLDFRGERDSPIQPSSGFAYWDAGNVVDTGGTASTLIDAFGANDIVNAIVSSRATIVPTATPAGRPALQFDGNDYYLKSYTRVQPTSRIVVAKFATTVGNQTLVDGFTLNTGRLYMVNPTTIGAYVNGHGTGISGVTSLTNWHVYRLDINTGSSMLFVDGILVASGILGAANPGGITIGAAAPGSTGQMAAGGLICAVAECDLADAAAWDNYLGMLHWIY